MTEKQIETRKKIESFAKIFGIDPVWATAVAMVESSLGEHQVSPTGCLGVFQMSNVAMKDLLSDMRELDDDLSDIACGMAFLHLLLERWQTQEEATNHFCDPNDRGFYWDRVKQYMEQFRTETQPEPEPSPIPERKTSWFSKFFTPRA